MKRLFAALLLGMVAATIGATDTARAVQIPPGVGWYVSQVKVVMPHKGAAFHVSCPHFTIRRHGLNNPAEMTVLVASAGTRSSTTVLLNETAATASATLWIICR